MKKFRNTQEKQLFQMRRAPGGSFGATRGPLGDPRGRKGEKVTSGREKVWFYLMNLSFVFVDIEFDM